MMRQHFERYLTDEEEKALFRTIAKRAGALARRDLAWLKLLRHTGIRVTPLSKLTVFDGKQALKSCYLTVRGEINKRGREHRIYLNKSAKSALKELFLAREEMGFAPRADSPLIMSQQGDAMTVRGFQKRMRYWATEAGLPEDRPISPHWLRHTLAKRLMQQSTARDPRGIVQAALGHASIASTSLYTLPDLEEIHNALEEVS